MSYSDTSELDITSLDDVHCKSPCRGDHLIIRPKRGRMSGVWSLRILEPKLESFLLIVRTRRIFTAVGIEPSTSSAGYSDVPAYSRILQPPF